MRGAVAFLFASLAAFGQLLTMEDAVARALATHPDLAAARASRAVFRFQTQAARALPAPEFRMTFNNLSLDPEMGEIRNSVAWRWSPPRPRELPLKARIAAARQRAAEAGILAAEARVAAAVRHSYRRAALAAERVQLNEQATALRRQMVELTRRQVALGLKESVETDLAEMALADMQAGLLRIESVAATEKRRLARLLDPAADVSFSLEPPPVSTPLPDRAAVLTQALRTRAELGQAAATCQQGEGELAFAANGRYPWVSFVQVTRRLGPEAAVRGPWGIQVGVDLPVFRSAAAAESRVAGANVERCRLEEAALRERIRRDVDDALTQFQASVAELVKLEQLAAGPGSKALEGARAALSAGRADRLDVLHAEARQLSLRDRWLERRLEFTQIEAQLELAAGR